jgi:hypothetical protein
MAGLECAQGRREVRSKGIKDEKDLSTGTHAADRASAQQSKLQDGCKNVGAEKIAGLSRWKIQELGLQENRG